MGILEHKGHLIHQLFRRDPPHIGAAHQHLPLLCVPKTRDQAGGSGLSSAGRADQRHRFSSGHTETDVRERRGFRTRIGKSHMPELNVRALGEFGVLRFRERRFLHDLAELIHRLCRLHRGLPRIHQAVNHHRAQRRKQDIEHEVHKYAPTVRGDPAQDHPRRDQQKECAVQDRCKSRHGRTVHHRVFRSQLAVAHDRGIKAFEGIHRLLEHLDHRDAPHVFRCFRAQVLNGALVAAKKLCLLPAHHLEKRGDGDCNGNQA